MRKIAVGKWVKRAVCISAAAAMLSAAVPAASAADALSALYEQAAAETAVKADSYTAYAARHADAADWRLDIFGQGEWHDMLVGKIEAAGLSDSAAVNPPTKQIAAEYARSGMLVMSSNYEGFPMVMIEAMGCGLPVVTFGFRCGPRDIIDNGKNGIVVKEGNIEALADAMLTLMSDDALRRAMSAEARKVSEHYSEERVMAQWRELFERLAANR